MEGAQKREKSIIPIYVMSSKYILMLQLNKERKDGIAIAIGIKM